jgi:hypothetical protein
MKNKFALNISLLILSTGLLFSQPLTERYNNLGEMFVPQFSSAMFPHPDRINGHTYKDKIFSKEEHYSDSSVAIFIPKDFKQSEKTNIVVYFHGWGNNIDKSCSKFNLIEQFVESNKNAIFVFPEGPKNASDSFGGRMEDKDGLKNLIDDVLSFLSEKEKVSTTNIGNIILAGHSGAYRVISFCLMHGGLTQNVSDVILFDALYGYLDRFSNWIENYNGRFINIYTDNGGTKSNSQKFMDRLGASEIPYFKVEEKSLKTDDLANNQLIFIHSDLGHSDVISKRNQFFKFLKTSRL